MVDSIVQVDTVTVTGGPSNVNVELDFGPSGQRGSLILYGLGKPTSLGVVFPQTPQLLDWYINLNTSDDEYLYIYQYVNRDGTETWDRIFKIIPNTYNVNQALTFTAGQATTTIAVSNTTLPLLSATSGINMHIQIEQPAVAPFPIASSFAITGEPSFDPETYLYSLPILVTAMEFNALTTQWQAVSGQRVVHFGINIVPALA